MVNITALVTTRAWNINSLRLSDAYMRHDLMACHLANAKPLSKPMMEYYQLKW